MASEVGVELMRGLAASEQCLDCLGRSECFVEQGAYRGGGERGLLQSGSGGRQQPPTAR